MKKEVTVCAAAADVCTTHRASQYWLPEHLASDLDLVCAASHTALHTNFLLRSQHNGVLMEIKDYFYHYSSVGIKFVYLCIVLECLILFVYLFEILKQNLIAQAGLKTTI